MEEKLPPGFRFHPTDEELIKFYLMPKVSDVSFTSKAIVDVDLNKSEPWDLPGKASMGEKQWYFFSMRNRKYPTGLRTNRATEAGYWKTTGKDKEIYGDGGVLVVGMKKTLVFYKGRAPKGLKTNWVMHEYRLHHTHPLFPTKEEWVVCRVFQKSSEAKKPQTSSQQSLGSPCEDTNSIVNEFGDIEIPDLMNNLANSSNNYIGYNINNNNNINVPTQVYNTNENMKLNHVNWPSTLLSSSSNLAMSSLILKALQLRSTYQQREEATSSLHDHYSFLAQGNAVTTPFGNDHFLGSNHDLQVAASSSSSSQVLEAATLPQPHQAPPFNWTQF